MERYGLNNNFLSPPCVEVKPKIIQDLVNSESPKQSQRRCNSENILNYQKNSPNFLPQKRDLADIVLPSVKKQAKKKKIGSKGALFSAAFNKINHM